MDDTESGDQVALDLFGRPVEPIRERRGRPSYAKTEENQRFVELRAAAGWTHEAIAQDMGIDSDTLRKHFSVELQRGRIKVEGVLLDVLMAKARQGHVPSVRELLDRVQAVAPPPPRRQAPVLADGAPGEAAPDPAEIKAPRPLGKKEAQLKAATEIPDDYGDILGRRNARPN